MTQFSLFGAEAAAPSLEDLDGLLLAGARWVRSGRAARLSVVVAERWRAEALVAAFVERSVAGQDVLGTAGAEPPAEADAGPVRDASPAGRVAARTAFSTDLLPHAARWTRGANQDVPTNFELSAGGLRLWAIAAGRRDEAGYLLATAASDDPLHRIAGSQLARLGIAAVALTQRPGPGWRVTSARRLRRFRELVGAPPSGAGDDWP